MNTNLPNWLKKSAYSKALSAAVLLLFTFAGFFFFQKLMQIKTQYALEQFYPKNHPMLAQDKLTRDRFGLPQVVPFIVLLESTTSSNWLEPRYLNELSVMTKKISALDEVTDIKGLANIETAITDDQSFTVGPLKDLAKNPLNREKILRDPLIAPHLISTDGKYAALIVSTKRLTFIQRSDFLKKLEKISEKKEGFFDSKISGPTAISVQIATFLQKEIVKYSGLSLLLSALIFFALFRNFSVIPLGLVLVVSANVISIGMLSAFGISLNMLSSTLPIILTLTVVSITTQTLSRLGEFKNKVLDRHRHIIVYRVIRELIGSHVLASATTAIGFAALMNSTTPLISDYGFSVTVSVMITCFVTLLLLSALAVWLPIPVKRKFPVSSEFAVQFISKHRHALFVGISLGAVLLAMMGRNLNWSPLLFDDLDKSNPVRKTILTLEEQMGGDIPLEISIGQTGATDAWKSPENVKKLEELVTTWRKKPGVGSVMALTDFLKATNQEHRLPASQKALSETYFIFAMAAENPLQAFTTTDGAFTRVALRLNDIPALQMQNIVQEFLQQARKDFPTMSVEPAGMAATLHPLNEHLSRELIFGFTTAMLWIMIMLVVVFRSVKWTLFSAVPNLVPPAILLGALAITQTPIKPCIAIIFAISLGLAFNNTVYVLLKLKKMIKKEKRDVLPVTELMREEFGPCFVSSCAVMAGFSVFLFSGFAMNQIFGAFMILSVMAGLLGDLVLLPTLLHIFPAVLLPARNDVTLEGHNKQGSNS